MTNRELQSEVRKSASFFGKIIHYEKVIVIESKDFWDLFKSSYTYVEKSTLSPSLVNTGSGFDTVDDFLFFKFSMYHQTRPSNVKRNHKISFIW